jgi:hypothetical protein
MVAPVPAQISSAARNVRTPSTLNSFRILTASSGVGTFSPVVFQASSLPYPASSPNPRWLILLRTLCRRQKPQPLSNQANPNSLCKTRGVGGVRRLRASVPPWQIQRFSSPLCFHTLTNPFFRNPFLFTSMQNPRGVTLPLLFRNSCLRVLCASVANPFFSYSCRLFGLSLRSFLRSFPLFSIACSLFSQNTRGGGHA